MPVGEPVLWLRLLPATLSCLTLGAHVLRGAGSFAGWFGASCLAFLPLLLLARQAWVPRLLAGVLVASSPLWLLTAWQVADERIAMGRPYLRMAVILGFVTAFFWWSAWLLLRPAVRAHYQDPSKP